MRRYAYNWLWLLAITIITGMVVWFCLTDIMVATNPDGLKIISKVTEGERTVFSLDCGATILQFSAKDYTTLEVGDYIPVFEEFMDSVNASITASSLFMGIVILFFLLELFRVPDFIRKQAAKKGTMINAEVIEFNHYIPGFYMVKVNGNGTKYTMRYPLTKRECKKYPIGTPAIVWNGGRKRRWVELQKPQ